MLSNGIAIQIIRVCSFDQIYFKRKTTYRSVCHLYYNLIMPEILQLQNKKSLCYLFENSNLQQSLPYIDQDISEIKGKVIYMIKTEQAQNMKQFNAFKYIQSLQAKQTPFLNSSKFLGEVQRIKNKMAQKQIESANKQKKKQDKSKQIHIDKQKLYKNKLTLQSLKNSTVQINQLLISYEQSKLKNMSVETNKMFSPLLLKQFIQSLEIQKQLLTKKINREKQQIMEINRLRKYQQLEARQREQTIQQRIKVMINKKRKVE